MLYSYKWLKELTKTKLSAEKIADLVNLRGFEVEGVEKLAGRYKDFVVGKVLEIKKHPKADRLVVVKTDVGKENRGKHTIVCGAKNFKVGNLVPVALPGAILPNSKIEIKKTDVREVESNGMLCAEDELGLGKDHEGIVILDDGSERRSAFTTGMPLAKALGLNDTVLEFDVLPNRAHDCLSYNGMANEICTMEGRKFTNHSVSPLTLRGEKKGGLKIEIKDKELCSRYIGAVLENMKVGPSPDWMQARLIASGMEPINNVVDITNYVMLEVGSPLHAFDLEKIHPVKSDEAGPAGREFNRVKIIVRRAKSGEKLKLLDRTNIKLDSKDLVIANPKKALALAGIKGGEDSGINDKTNTIVLEAANFNKLNIRKTRQRHALLTESQARFEKGIAPELAERAAARAIELLKKHTGAKLVEMVDENYHRPKTQIETLELSYLDSLLGYEMDKKRAVEILQNLGFEAVKQNKEKVSFKVPFWRLDVEGPEDLIEEVGRIEGYEKIEEKEAFQSVSVPDQNESRKFEWRMKEFLCGLGFDEVMNYSFYSAEDVAKCGLKNRHFELENPLSEDLKFLRTSLVPGLLKNVAHNAKYFGSFAIFELGRTYKMDKNEKPIERLMLAGATYNEDDKSEEFYNVKARIEEMFSRMFGLEIFFRSKAEYSDKILHPVRSAVIEIESGKKQTLGCLGDVAPTIAKKYGIKKQVDIFELDFETFRENSRSKKCYRPLRKYPTTLRDISMFVPTRTETATIVKAMKKAGGKDLIKIDLFDVFLDKKKNRKSMAFHLTFAKDDRTMKSKEVDALMKKVGAELKKVGARVRIA